MELPVWPRCEAAWTSGCRGVVAVITVFQTVRATHTISMDFCVNVQVIFRVKLLPTFITTVHFRIGHFFSDAFQRWYLLGLHNVRISQPLNGRRLLTFVAFTLVYPQTIVRFEGVSTKVTLEGVFSLLWQINLVFKRYSTFEWIIQIYRPLLCGQ